MVEVMSNRQIFLIAIALGFIGGFSFVAAAQSMERPEVVSYKG